MYWRKHAISTYTSDIIHLVLIHSYFMYNNLNVYNIEHLKKENNMKYKEQ